MKILLGYKVMGDEVTSEPVNFNLDKEGVMKILGMTKSGKSCNTMNIAIAASKHRQVIIFSYGDEYDNMIYSNPFSLKPDSIDSGQTILIQGVKLKVSDLDELGYWRYLMPEGAARFAWNLAKQKELHHDIPEQFFRVASMTPTTRRVTQDDVTIHEASLTSLMAAKVILMEIMGDESIDWQKLVATGKNIIINLKLSAEERWKSQFIVGYILHKIKLIIHKTKPLIIFEMSSNKLLR